MMPRFILDLFNLARGKQMKYQSPLDHEVLQWADDQHEVWAEIAPELTPERDFDNPYEMDVAFLRLLSKIRRAADVPFRVISDARPTDGDVGVIQSAHKERPCRAVDLQVNNNYERAVITIEAIRHGIVRWGTYTASSDSGGGGLHLDASTENPSPRNWTRRG